MEGLLKCFVERADRDGLAIEGIALADEERVIAEHRFRPDLPRNIYSHTKSYMVTGIGIALDRGLISLDDRLAEAFPESLPERPDPRLMRITLRDLLTMSSGFGRGYLMSADRRKGIGAPDYISYMLSRPVIKEPGTEFDYSSADSHLALRMAEKAVGERFGAFLYRELLEPLGLGYPLWEHDPEGHPFGGGGMHLRLTDMLRLGQLYLSGGNWKGSRLISPEWIREAAREQIPTPGRELWNCGYGYQFWMCPYPDAWRADGAYGQITCVLPRSGKIVAVQCPETGDFAKVRLALHEEILTRI